MRRFLLWFRFRRTLIDTVIARTEARDHYREHAHQAIRDRDEAWREAAQLKRERDAARATAQDALR